MPLNLQERKGDTELIKSLRDRDGWPHTVSLTHTFKHIFTHSLEIPPAVSGRDVHRLPP